MTARQALNATYAFLVGLVGRDNVGGLLGADDGPREPGGTTSVRSDPRTDAAENRSAISLLSELGKLPRVAGAR